MASGDITQKWGTAGTFTHGIASLATSSTKLVGWETAALDLSAIAFLEDLILNIKITTGTSPTASKSIEVWAIAYNADATWPGVFDGTSSAETIASAEEKSSLCRQLVVAFATNSTSNIAYETTGISLASLFPAIPKQLSLFVTHDTGVDLHATAGNHVFGYIPVYRNVSA